MKTNNVSLPDKTLLVVDDNRAILQSVRLVMSGIFADIFLAQSPDSATTVTKGATPDVVLLDMNFHAGVNNGNEGLYWLGRLRERWPCARFVLFTAYADVDLAVRGLKEGASDFIVKPWDNDRLIEALTEGLAPQKSKSGVNSTSSVSNMLWGDSEPMRILRKTVERVAATDANILITGENGTGKDLLAREIHALSSRSVRPLVSVDMGAVSETLFESELFGHVKGAFTGADSDRMGRFEAANGSSLFLDEIGNLSLSLQAKMLTVLQRRQVTRVGCNHPVDVDIRLICATNRNLEQMVADGTFRQDLLYRVNTIHLELPPLRDRGDDLFTLADTFVRRLAGRYGRAASGLSASAKRKIADYSWPGNIRELEHTIERAVIMSEGSLVEPADISLPESHTLSSNGMAASARQPATLDSIEAAAVRDAVERSGGNMSLAAQQLGITRQTLYNKMKKYGI